MYNTVNECFPRVPSHNMTYILGSRCSDGVVIVADRKVTIDQGTGGIDHIYESKLYGEFRGIITGFSGLRQRYESFIIAMTEYLNRKRGEFKWIPCEKFLMKASDIVSALPSRNLDILFGFTSDKSSLKHMFADGGIETINRYVVIGTGETVGRFF
jgi:20S proteasome alpha/beta subunit